MVEAVVKGVDRANGKVVVEVEDGKEVTLTVNDDTDITIMELETAGDEDGTLDDIGEGFVVTVEFTEDDNGCVCHSLNSIS